MEREFLNVYIEKMAKKVEDLTKQEIFHRAQLEIAQRLIADQKNQIAELTDKLEKLEASLNRKASKQKESNDF